MGKLRGGLVRQVYQGHIVALQGAAAPPGPPGDPPELTFLVLTPTTLALDAGDSATLHVAAYDQYSNPMDLPALTKHTDDAAVAVIGTIAGAVVPVNGIAGGAVDVWVSSGAVSSNHVATTVAAVVARFFDRRYWSRHYFSTAYFR